MNSSFSILLVLALFFIGPIVLRIYLRRTKGKRGELHVARRLAQLPSAHYKVINDLLIQREGHSTQIDHVVVSAYGIFVIETKFYQGWILGGENSEFWTQTIYGSKSKFLNPLWQNHGHIKTIARVLGDYGKLPFYSIVAFSSQATLKVDRSLPVMYWSDVVPYIKRFAEPLIADDRVEQVYSSLLALNADDKEARRQHVTSVQQNKVRRNSAVSSGRCPRCGGTLVLRDGKYGRFYGCSNYPNCRYILNSR